MSLLVIVVVSVLATAVARLVFHDVIPEAVFLLIFGVIIGKQGLDIAHLTDEINILRELGIAFLFLLAGFEVNIDDLKGKPGIAAFGAWIVSLLTAFLIIELGTNLHADEMDGAAISIVMTATALGTLLPVLKDRKLIDTIIGRTVMAHGAAGEIGPIIMMAVALSLRSTWQSILILLAFSVIAIVVLIIPIRVRQLGLRIVDFIHWGAETTAQTSVRITVALLVGLVALASFMDLDIVLGAFVAGFIVRQTIPNGREELETKLDGLAYGFFIPVFFVVSGMEINAFAISDVTVWGAFFLLMLLVRGVPVFVSTWFFPGSCENTMLMRNRITVGLYSTTSLPIIVAVTHVAVLAKAMSEETASALVIAGGATVVIMPLLAYITEKAAQSELLYPGQKKRRKAASRPIRPTEKSGEASEHMRAKKRPSTVKMTGIFKKKRDNN